jgi:hypothetical protein
MSNEECIDKQIYFISFTFRAQSSAAEESFPPLDARALYKAKVLSNSIHHEMKMGPIQDQQQQLLVSFTYGNDVRTSQLDFVIYRMHTTRLWTIPKT